MKKIKYYIALLLAGTIGFTSCVDADIDDALDYDDHYQTPEDAANAVLGAYSTFLRLSEQMIVLNELRGDLLDLTTNSSVALQEIDRNQPSKDNKYADPTAFYTVINNCNDCLDNFEKMYNEKSLNAREFLEYYSDIMALRSYVYLQLVAQYGEVPYIDKPVVTVEDMNKAASVKLGIDKMLDQLIADMTSVTVCGKPVSLEPYVESPLVQYTLDGYNLSYMFINKYLLMADLYLWRANDVDKADYYEKAATYYKKIMDTRSDGEATENCYYMKVGGVDTWADASDASSKNYYQNVFSRYHEDNVGSFIAQWGNMFSDAIDATRIPKEWVWLVSFEEKFAPEYPFVKLFAPASQVEYGEYQLKPSDYAVDELWNAQTMKNGFSFDGRGEGASFIVTPEGNAVYKYMANTVQNPVSGKIENQGRLFLYRAGLVHLRYAEAVNRAGNPKLAFALLNQGIRETYGTTDGYLIVGEEGTPYYFPASWTEAGTVYGYRREAWRVNRGVRGRVALVSAESSQFADKTLAECTTPADSIKVMEKIILDEVALECGYEGNRYPDLVRVAHRMNLNGEGGDTYFANVQAGKYRLNGRTNPYTGGEKSWFLPFKE